MPEKTEKSGEKNKKKLKKIQKKIQEKLFEALEVHRVFQGRGRLLASGSTGRLLYWVVGWSGGRVWWTRAGAT